MERTTGVYVMQVASMLTGMHPQTLRKYERAGFLAPSRSKALRMYSDEDIARLKTIKHLVDEVGLNLAGVSLALQLRDSLLGIKQELVSSNISFSLKKRLAELFDKTLKVISTD